jgi:hypothetical protein
MELKLNNLLNYNPWLIPGRGACTQVLICLGTPNLGVSKFPKLGILQIWRPITSYANLRLR